MVTGQLASGFISLMLAKFILNDMPHAVLDNPSNPSSSMTSDIVARAGMKEYEYRYFPEPEEPRKPRVYPYTKVRRIGPYEVRMTRTDDTCTIKLYEYLEGWKRKLKATWTGIEKVECDRKFDEIAEVIRQVRFEHKTALMR